MAQPRDRFGNSVPMLEQVGTNEALSYSATSTQSAVCHGTALGFRIVSNTAFYYKIGSDPTVATSGANLGTRLPANTVEFVPVNTPGTDKLAVIQDTSPGTVNICSVR